MVGGTGLILGIGVVGEAGLSPCSGVVGVAGLILGRGWWVELV